MKFVATTAFHNAPELSLDLDPTKPGIQHEDTVPKGHRFEIAPESKAIKSVTKESDKQVISKLVMFGWAVVDDGSPESKDAIKKIDDEVTAEKAAAAAAEKNRPLSIGEQIALGVAEALKAAGVKKP